MNKLSTTSKLMKFAQAQKVKKALGMEKMAWTPSYSYMQDFLGGQQPLTHMVNGTNVIPFMQTSSPGYGLGSIFSPSELAMNQTGAQYRTPKWGGSLSSNEYTGPYAPKFQKTMQSANPAVVKYWDSLPAKTRLGLRADANYHALGSPSSYLGNRRSANQTNISLSEGMGSDYGFGRHANGTFGDVGVMTTPSRIARSGTGTLSMPNVPLGNKERLLLDLHPRLRSTPVAGGTGLELPRLNGRLVYDPQAVMKMENGHEIAKALKARGAMPLNRRTRAMIQRINKNNSTMPVERIGDMQLSQDENRRVISGMTSGNENAHRDIITTKELRRGGVRDATYWVDPSVGSPAPLATVQPQSKPIMPVRRASRSQVRVQTKAPQASRLSTLTSSGVAPKVHSSNIAAGVANNTGGWLSKLRRGFGGFGDNFGSMFGKAMRGL